jgi:hypothetical protein
VERLEDRDQVVPPGEPRVGGVAVVERDPVLDAAALEVLAGESDRRHVRVDSVDVHLGVRARDLDARAALPARDVGDAGRWVGEEPVANFGHTP